jgi:hypothetical protein
MRHLRVAALEVALLAGRVVRAAALGLLVALGAAALAGPAGRRRAHPPAVDITPITPAADAGQTPTTATSELAVRIRRWPHRAQQVIAPLRAPSSSIGRGLPRARSCTSGPSPRFTVKPSVAGSLRAGRTGLALRARGRSRARLSPGTGGSRCTPTAGRSTRLPQRMRGGVRGTHSALGRRGPTGRRR